MTTTVLSNRYQVSGFVRNLVGGRVELVAEGTKAELDSFVSAVERAMKGNIERTEVVEEGATGEFKGFGVVK